MLLSALLMALREIRRNVMRSVLTTLGIVIGVAAVIAMVHLGEGATARVTGEIASLGQNMLIVAPGSARRGGMAMGAPLFDRGDVDAIEREVPGVKAAAPISARGVRVVYGNQNETTVLDGTTDAFFEVRDWPVVLGRTWNEGEERSGTAVCVIGETIQKELFDGQDPLGAKVRVGNVPCEVIGVLEARGRSTFGEDQDDVVLMPLLAFQRRIAGSTDVGMIMVSAVSEQATPTVQRQIESLLRQRRHVREGQEDDFVVRNMKEVVQIVETATGVLTTLLGAIAAVSLLVGGIGIMNIMLVSVTERTREIGIRLAIGARGREVLLQFLVEAVVLSTLGGVIGIGLGLGGSYVAAHALRLPFVFVPGIVVVAFVFSAAVGVFFGFHPARKAARLDPIDALRYE